jgi:RNA polymerase sigma-70 factor (ECF subfamily)
VSEEREIDDTQFEEWYLMAHPRVLAALTAYCGDPDEASEAADEAFARAFLKWGTLKGGPSPTGWTFVIGRNVIRRRHWRSRLERERWQTVAERRARPASDQIDEVSEASEVAELLRPLSDRKRTAVLLHHGLDLPQEKVAKLMGVTRSTVASALSDARRKIAPPSAQPATQAERQRGRHA